MTGQQGASAKEPETAEVVLPCPNFAETLSYFTEQLGFAVEQIFPADNPRVAVISAHGVRLRLDQYASGTPGTLRMTTREINLAGQEIIAPNGTVIQWVPAFPPVTLPPEQQSFVHTPMHGKWVEGRAGMHYRDLIPDRQGGRFIASHIRIDEGGPVPDYVHYHRILFQFIYCWKGWVKVVYEDQGMPLIMEAGDCVLQPPQIRHRVLECSAGLQVIEVGCPADHETRADPEMILPTGHTDPERRFGRQRFRHFQASKAQWLPGPQPGVSVADTGLDSATGGVVDVRVLRLTPARDTPRMVSHLSSLLFCFVLDGSARLSRDGQQPSSLGTGDAVVIPGNEPSALTVTGTEATILEVRAPGSGGPSRLTP